jgi:hypothetical protein
MTTITDTVLIPQVWGPHYWYFLHTSFFQYPETPTIVTKKIYYDMITHFGTFIPDEKIATYYNQLLNEYPISPYLDNKVSIVKWGWFIHNKVNKKLKKPSITLEEFYIQYYNSHKNYTIQINMKWFMAIKEFVLYVLVIFILLYICYILYNYPYLVLH